MKYTAGDVTKTTKILFPIVVTIIAGIVAPKSVALVGFLMFGNLIRECGVLNNLSETAQIHLQIFSQFFSVSPLHHKCIMRILLSRKHFLFSDSVLLRSSLIRLAVLFCKIPQSLLTERKENQPDDRRRRYFCIPDERSCCKPNGTQGR